ncbi:MAG TPA: hypothetical protein VN653_11310, partial [Anaerolineales bacterium]|nr:hypothetical protein [Anaerolineales bacterium]
TAILAARQTHSAHDEPAPTPGLINAIRLLGALPSLTQSSHMLFWTGWREIYERAVARIHDVADKETWAKAYTEGQGLTLAQAVAIALQELGEKRFQDSIVQAGLEGKDGI